MSTDRTTTCAVLLVGHGTIRALSDIDEFLRRIRRGRPAPPEFVSEIRRRYDHIGGSPLLRTTESLARALSDRTSLPVHVAMRFWEPLIEDVVHRLVTDGVTELVVVPVAPFSVGVYADVVRDAAAKEAERAPRVVSVAPYGSHPLLLAAHAGLVAPFVAGKSPRETALVLTAHSLPVHVIASGDAYQREFEASARALLERVSYPGHVAYQSQGEGGGEWLGPTLLETLRRVKGEGARRVVVAPVGFLADHVETLYDLDVEACTQAKELGLEFARVPALGDSPPLVEALAEIVREARAS